MSRHAHPPGRVWRATTGPPGAPRVVLVHGSLDRSAGLLRLSRRLDDRFRVTRYDRRGYGRSIDLDGPFDVDAHVADVIEVLGDDPGRPCVVVGHSFGGHVALAAAERRDDLVDGVVVYESPLSWEPWWPGSSAGGDAVAWAHDPEEAAERFMRRLIGDARWDRLPPSTRRARRAEGPAMVAELADLRRRAPWTAEQIAQPVVALAGEHGAEHHRRAVEALGERLPAVRVATIDGARHFGPNTHADAVAVEIVGLLDRLVGQAS